jgi:hypothetical protein
MFSFLFGIPGKLLYGENKKERIFSGKGPRGKFDAAQAATRNPGRLLSLLV